MSLARCRVICPQQNARLPSLFRILARCARKNSMDAPCGRVLPPDLAPHWKDSSSMKRFTKLLSLLSLLFLPARAPAVPPQQVIDAQCRSHLFAGASKLGKDTIKQLGKCHSQRLNGQLPASTDCNQESNAPWAHLRQR